MPTETGDEQLVRESLGEPDGDPTPASKAVIDRTHLLLLKVEFEYFLNRVIHCVWDHHLPDLSRRPEVRRILSRKKYNQENEFVAFALAAGRGEAKEYVLRKVVPSHGLDGMQEVLTASTGIDLFHQSGDRWRNWAQIRSAFEVRHLIEHNNGRMDQKFLDKFNADENFRLRWKSSTWGSLPAKEKEKVLIRAEDFEKTLGAMLPEVSGVTEAAKEFVPGGQ